MTIPTTIGENWLNIKKVSHTKYVIQSCVYVLTCKNDCFFFFLQSFENFVKLIIERKLDDEHVELFWKHCGMCNMDYDIIGKMETSLTDTKFIMEKVMIYHLQHIFLPLEAPKLRIKIMGQCFHVWNSHTFLRNKT